MIQAISIASGNQVDAEYLRIIQELRSLGLSPSGNKAIDAQKLANAKNKLVEKIQQNKNVNEEHGQPMYAIDEREATKRAELEEKKPGAMTVAQLNRIYFGL